LTVTRDQALVAVTGYLRDAFGPLVSARDVRPVRRAAGMAWQFRVVAPSSAGKLPLFELELDEDGAVRPRRTISDVVDAIRTSMLPPPPSLAPAAVVTPPAALAPTSDEFAQLFEDLAEPSGEAAGASHEPSGPAELEALRAKVKDLIDSDEPADHERARLLLPRLLVDASRRGITLIWLGEIERRLGDSTAAMAHLEAAAGEFAERFEMPALERCATIAMSMLPRGAFAGSLVQRLVEGARARVRPLESLFDAGPFAAVDPAQRSWLVLNCDLRPLDPGEVLLREGAPASAVYVVKSGLLAVSIELPEGGERRVRYCHPGWVLGEGSVLHHDRLTSSATLRAEGPAEVWVIQADAIRRVMAHDPSLRQRLGATKHLNRLDSFFTTHTELGRLEVLARDELIHAVSGVEEHDDPTVVLTAGKVPSAALLVAAGEVTLHDDRAPAQDVVLGADSFVGVRDAIHATPAPRTVVARPGATLVWFDALKLRALANADPRVAAVLERVG
jgi:CRP-like cAMP-binding protein